MTVTLFIAQALLCIAGQCNPVLIGEATPVGTFPLRLRRTLDMGEVIVYRDTPRLAYAIHTIPAGMPRRHVALGTETPADNRITAGCINVSGEDFRALKARILAGEAIELRITSTTPNDKGVAP